MKTIPRDEWGDWGAAGSTDHPTGLGIVNLRTREMRILGQVPMGDPGRSVWHVNGSADGRWAVADDFRYRLWLFDRHTGERILFADAGHKRTAADHLHPTFKAEGNRIEIQSAMLSENGGSLNICVVPVPRSWLARTYPGKITNSSITGGRRSAASRSVKVDESGRDVWLAFASGGR